MKCKQVEMNGSRVGSKLAWGARTRRVLKAVCTASMVVIVGVSARADDGSVPIANDAFYLPPADLSAFARGDVIRSEVETDMDNNLFHGARAYRFMYRSEGALGDAIAATAMAFLPNGAPPASGWNIAVWAHGTTGVGDACAVTKYANLYQVNWTGYGKAAAELRDAGFLTVAVDYEGLGTPGLSTYMNGPAAANAIIDAVRAARQLGYATSGKFGVLGHSQGSMAARATNVSASAAAVAPLQFVGSVEIAATATRDYWPALIGGLAGNKGGLPLLGYLAAGMRAIDPSFPYADFVGPALLAEMGNAEVECWSTFSARFQQGSPYVDPNQYLNPDWQQSPTAGAFLDAALYGFEGETSHGPVLAINGSNDSLFGANIDAFQDQLCAAGTNLTSVVFAGKDHVAAFTAGLPIGVSWLKDRFAGVPAHNDCLP